MLYINGYDGTATVRLRMALPFFELALPLAGKGSESYTTVSCYAGIGRYYRDYIWTTAAKEVSAEDVEVLLEDIRSTLCALTDNSGADQAFNYLGFADAVCNLIYDQRDILASTTQKDIVIAILNAQR